MASGPQALSQFNDLNVLATSTVWMYVSSGSDDVDNVSFKLSTDCL